MQRQACWTRRGSGRLRVRPRQRLPRRRLRPPLLARRRPPAPHPRPDRQRDQGTGRPLDAPLPPGDLRPRQDRQLHLRGEPAPRADPRLGVEWQEVATASPRSRASATSSCGRFSTRRAEILEAAGPGASAAPGRSRPWRPARPRTATSPRRACASAGGARAAEIGLDREAIGATPRPRAPGPDAVLTVDAGRPRGHRPRLPLRPPRRDPGRRRRPAPHGAPAAEVEALADAFLASESVIRDRRGPPRASASPRSGSGSWSSGRWRRRADASAATDASPGDVIVVSRVLDARPSLKADQRAMVAPPARRAARACAS